MKASLTSQGGFASFLGRLFVKQSEKALDSPYLALLVLASFLLSAASFFTTYQGMQHFMHVSLIAASITFAIQALLLVTSWQIGFMYAEEAKVSGMIMVIFIITFMTSVFFSFSSLFDYVFDTESAETTRMSRVHDAVENSNNELNALSRKREFDLVSGLLVSQGYVDWRDNMDKVALAALEAKERLRGILKKRAEESARQARELASKAGELEARKEFLTKDLVVLEANIRNFEEERALARSQVNELRRKKNIADQNVFAKETEMDAEARGGDPDSNRPRGKGPVWLRLKQQRDKLAAERDGIAKSLEGAEKELKSYNDSLLDMQQRLTAHKAELSGIDANIESSKAEATKAQVTERRSRQDDVFDPESVVAKMRSNVTEFSRTRELAPFDEAAGSCELLLAEMSDTPEIRESVQGLSCDRGAMELQINQIVEESSQHAEFKDRCIKGGDKVQVVNDLPFDDALNYGFECIGLAGLPLAVVSDITGELRRIQREESPTASKFTVTTNAIIAGEKLAWFALIGAIVIDALVLACGLIGAKSTRSPVLTALDIDLKPHDWDSQEIRNNKLLLSHVSPISHKFKGSKNYEAEVDLDDVADDHDRLNLKNILMNLASLQQAVHDHEAKGVFYLTNGLLQQLREVLSANQEKTIMRRGSATPVVESQPEVYTEESDSVISFDEPDFESPQAAWPPATDPPKGRVIRANRSGSEGSQIQNAAGSSYESDRGANFVESKQEEDGPKRRAGPEGAEQEKSSPSDSQRSADWRKSFKQRVRDGSKH